MKLTCDKCGKEVSTEIPDGTIVRAWIECPECSGRDDNGNNKKNKLSD